MINAETQLELTNVEISWKEYLTSVVEKSDKDGLWLLSFFKDTSKFPEGDFTYELPEETDPYPNMVTRPHYLTQGLLSYGRKDNKFWLRLRELDKKGYSVETLRWDEDDDLERKKNNGLCSNAFHCRFFNYLRVNGFAEIWIQYWFDMIYQSIVDDSIIDVAGAGGGYESLKDDQEANLDDWVKYCIAEIQSHMSFLDKDPNKTIVD